MKPTSTLSSPASSSRAQNSQQAKLIEHWDSLSPLSDLERQSIHSIQKSINDNKPLPSNLRNDLINHHQLGSNNQTHNINSNNQINITALNNNNNNNNRSISPSASIFRLINSHSNSRLTFQEQQQQQQSEEEESYSGQLDYHQPIASIDKFNDWFSTISSQIEADSESDYLSHLSLLSTYLNACDLLDQAIDDCRGSLNEIDGNWRFVDENSKSLERSCEGMLEEQKVLSSFATGLNERLAYFRRLDEAQRILSRPGEAEIVKSPEFLPMIERLDVCLEFMKLKRHFRDADLYLVRFQQCLTRSMTLIKLHYTNQIKGLCRQVQEKLQINQQSASSSMRIEEQLLYEKFRSLSEELRPLISQVEKRFMFDPEEYGSLLSDFFSTWFTVRNQLLHGRLKVEINRIQISHEQVPDLISLATTGCNYLRSVCTAEWNLFKAFFPQTGEVELFSYLESLCDYLYDLLRPQVLHEQKLDLLCDLATISNALIAMDSTLLDEPNDRGQASRFKFSSLLKPILQDIQTRLIFRAQAIIQTEVANYQPKREDIDYPHKLISKLESQRQKSSEKLKGSQKVKNQDPNLTVEQSRVALKFRLPSEEVQQTWYPTLRKTLWVLSKLHTYVNDAIFEDFAGEAVGICSESIIKAANLIPSASNQAGPTHSDPAKITAQINANSIDRELFVIRHLLILKEMIRTLDVTQVERAVDLGPITDVLREILKPNLIRDSLIFQPITLINRLKSLNSQQFSKRLRLTESASKNDEEDERFSDQQQITKTIDSKSEVDVKLKTVCHEFIRKSTSLICSKSIEGFMIKCQNFLNLEASMQNSNQNLPVESTSTIIGGLNRNLADQEWASQEFILTVLRSFLNDLQLGLKVILNRVYLYFNPHDHDDEEDFNLINVLFPALQDQIMEHYKRFYNLIKFEFDLNLMEEGGGGVGEGKKAVLDHDAEQALDDGPFSRVDKVLSPEKIHDLIQDIVYHHSCD